MSRLLFPIHYPVFGGPHNQALRLAGALERHGWSTTVVLPDEPGNAAGRLRAAGLDVVTMPLHRLRASASPRAQAPLLTGMRREVRALRRLVRERGVDLVQLADLVNPHAAFAARAEGAPVVWQLVDRRPPAPVRRTLTPVAGRLADVLMFNGQRTAELYTDGLLPHQPSLVFYPPVDPDVFRPRPELRAQARASLGVPEDGHVVGMVANLNPLKGVEYFVQAAALVERDLPGCHFVVVGAAYDTHRRYQDALLALTDELGLAKRLTFAGARDDVELVYQAMDLKLVTSRCEGTTTTAIEAMACGVPVVTTDAGAVHEVVADGETGLVVPPRQPAALAEAVVGLLADQGRLADMGAAARDRVQTRLGLDRCVETHLRAYEAALARRPRPGRGASEALQVAAARPDPLDRLRALLRCPACRGALAWTPEQVDCDGCGRHYTVTDGIPVLVLDTSDAEHDELDHEHGHGGHGGHGGAGHDGHAARQAAWFDRDVAEAFEIRRPHGTPALHAWLLGEKLRRALSGIETVVPGGTALTVCGGSGMDAEYLARAGAAVIASDVSLGAARRAAERARRSMLPVLPVVAAVESLPLADQAVDLVLVHDGLHHLEDPMVGVREMARVAGRAVSITEPAKAAVTAVAVRLGLADEVEESGNGVARLRPRDLAEALERDGLRVRAAERYAMFYRHQPGRATRLLSKPGPLPAATAWRAANTVLGRLGNKLTVTALRPLGDRGGAGP